MLELISVLHDERALAGAHDVLLQGPLAFVAGKGRGGKHKGPEEPGAVELFDISDPRRLRSIHRTRFEGLGPDHDMACRDGFIYFTDQDDNRLGVVAVVDEGVRGMMESNGK